jgi:hypothetical protein
LECVAFGKVKCARRAPGGPRIARSCLASIKLAFSSVAFHVGEWRDLCRLPTGPAAMIRVPIRPVLGVSIAKLRRQWGGRVVFLATSILLCPLWVPPLAANGAADQLWDNRHLGLYRSYSPNFCTQYADLRIDIWPHPVAWWRSSAPLDGQWALRREAETAGSDPASVSDPYGCIHDCAIGAGGSGGSCGSRGRAV